MAGVAILPEESAGVAAMVVLAAGLGSLFLGYSWFWMVFAVGYAAVVPLVAMLSEDGGGDEGTVGDPAEPGGTENESRTEALETLRDRYARGELTDEEFERKLEALMETETPEGAERRVDREREREPGEV